MIVCKSCSKEFPDSTELLVCDRCLQPLSVPAARAAAGGRAASGDAGGTEAQLPRRGLSSTTTVPSREQGTAEEALPRVPPAAAKAPPGAPPPEQRRADREAARRPRVAEPGPPRGTRAPETDSPREPGVDEPAPTPNRPAAGDPEPAPVPQPERERRQTQEPSPAPAVRTRQPELEPLDADQLDVLSAYGKQRSIISVIGFGDSGKTFFVNRLRALMLDRGWDCNPLPEDRIERTARGIVLSNLVPVNEARAGGRQDHSYLIVDCAGEYFKDAFENQRSARSLGGVAFRSYLATLGLASAYILVLKAEDLVPASSTAGDPEASEERKWLEAMLKTFYTILDGIVVARERLAKQTAREFLNSASLSKEELDEAAFRTRRRFRQPMTVIFSLADRLEGRDGVNAEYDLDPYRFAMQRANRLYQAIARTFDYYRFDFLSAFYKHDSQGPADKREVDYGLRSYGTAEIFDWIRDLIHPGTPVLGAPLRLARGRLPTRHAVRLRALIDPDFRRALRP
jgi:hypothetical protein